jgi:lipid A biosynthesis lauroyl acyltransferase
MEVIEKDEHTSKKLISKLKEKKIYALFSDHRDKGAIVNFFGKETKAPSGAVSMALKFDMPLLLVYNVLNDDNTITIYVSDEIQMIKTGNFKEDVQSNVQLLINKMEDIIRENPTQWMWFHDRWNNFREYKSMKKKGSL